MNIIKNWKFEYIFSFVVIAILTTALFVFKDNDKITIPIVTVLISTLTAITTFFFTRHQIMKESEE